MKKLSPAAYKALFFKHVFHFLENVTAPFELAKPQVVGVSGGADSMALLWFAHELELYQKIGPVRAVFVHHQTRSGQDKEAELVKIFCQERGIAFKTLFLEGLKSGQGNFEHKARSLRRDLLLSDLAPGEKLWLGHHLDDSYEWNMMQRHRSDHPKSSLGIPVRNGPIIRPFICVSRKQIRRLIKIEAIPFSEDPSNLETKFERNYVRHEIIPHISKRYPKYLKHYVRLANFWAVTLHLTVTNRIDGNKIFVYENGAFLVGEHFSQFEIQELIHSYSKSKRGEVTSQILHMLKAIENHKKGPFHFSGAVEAYHSHQSVMIYSQGMKNYDHSIAKILKKLSIDQLDKLPSFNWQELEGAWNNLLKSSDALSNLPGLVLVIERDSLLKTLNTSVYDSLFPEVSEVCKSQGWRFVPALKCLEVWKRKSEKLPERLRLLPLWTLSNLFSFQES